MRNILLALLLLFSHPVAAADPIYALNGANVGVLSNSQMVIEPFSFWAWGPIGTPGFGGQMVSFTSTIYPDITTIGCNGMDANPNGAGNMPPDGAYMLFAFYNPSTDATCFQITKQISISGLSPPSGSTHWRKMNYGVVVRNGALVTNHVSGWPLPTVEFTQTETNYIVASFTAKTNGWVAVDLSKLIPENSRMGIFRAIVSGGAATAWISPSGNSPGNQFWKTLVTGANLMGGQVRSRVDGNEKIWVWVDSNGARVDIILDGFVMTEVN